MEPPPWYYPVRQSLGAVLLEAGRAKEAEAVYREDLKRYPENGWSLFGLAKSLRAQGRAADAVKVEHRFRRAWAQADVQPIASRF
jgi:tetratricopeptide (TPR) repeat protein